MIYQGVNKNNNGNNGVVQQPVQQPQQPPKVAIGEPAPMVQQAAQQSFAMKNFFNGGNKAVGRFENPNVVNPPLVNAGESIPEQPKNPAPVTDEPSHAPSWEEMDNMAQNNVNNSNDNGGSLSLSDVLKGGGDNASRDEKSQFVADPEKKDGGFFKWIKGLLPKSRPGMREGETEDEYDRRRTRNMQMVATLTDAIRHIGNIVNTSKGATQQKFNSPVELLEQGYQQRKAERQKQAALDADASYKKASLSLKQAAAEAAERHRQFADKLGLTNLAYKQSRDAVNDAHWNQNYDRMVNNDTFNHKLATDRFNESKRHNSVSENQGQQRINLTAIREARMATGGGSGSGGGKGSSKDDRFATPSGYMSRKTKLSGIEKKQLAQYLIKHGYINEDNLTAYKNLSLLDNSKGVNDLVNSWIGYAANTRGARGAVFRNILKNNYGYSESSTAPKLPTKPAAKPKPKGKSGGKKGWASGFKL